MKRKLLRSILCVLAAITLLAFSAACTPDNNRNPENKFKAKPVEGSPLIFDEGLDYYTVAPSVVTEGNGGYVFYTVNATAKDEDSTIAVRKYTLENGKKVYGDKTTVITGGEDEFDFAGASDPDVVKGSFSYKGTGYSYLMAYQGAPDYSETNHKIGFAVANDPLGEWTKVDGLYISGLSDAYGVAQPSLINFDKQNKLALFYSFDYGDHTSQMLRELEFADLDAPVVGVENELATDGLKEGNEYVTFNDADFAYDSDSGYLYVVRNYNPAADKGVALPTGVQVAKILFGDLFEGAPRWTVVSSKVDWKALRDPDNADSQGWSRAYSACFAADAYGYVDRATKLDMVISVTSFDEVTYEYLFRQAMTEYSLSL